MHFLLLFFVNLGVVLITLRCFPVCPPLQPQLVECPVEVSLPEISDRDVCPLFSFGPFPVTSEPVQMYRLAVLPPYWGLHGLNFIAVLAVCGVAV